MKAHSVDKASKDPELTKVLRRDLESAVCTMGYLSACCPSPPLTSNKLSSNTMYNSLKHTSRD